MGTWTWRGYISSDEHVITGQGAGINATKGPMKVHPLLQVYSPSPAIQAYIQQFPPEMWGPYKKTMVQRFGLVHQPPVDVDGVPILCQCRDIANWERGVTTGKLTLTAEGLLLFGKNPPACWDHDIGPSNPTGGDTYNVYVRHPAFYQYALNPNGALGILGNVAMNRLGFQKPTLTILGMRLLGGRRKTKRNKRRSRNRKTQRR